MSIDLAAIIALLSKIEGLGELTIEAWKDLKERMAQEADEKKRAAYLDAYEKRDLAAIRKIIFSVGQ